MSHGEAKGKWAKQIESAVTRVDLIHITKKKKFQMTFRYANWLAFIKFAAALAMVFALYVGTNPKFWGWLLFLPLFLTIVIDGIRTYRYSLTVDGDCISVVSFNSAQYLVSEITAINVWVAKGGRIAVVTFSDQRRLSFPSRLLGFDKLVELLRTQAKLPKPISES